MMPYRSFVQQLVDKATELLDAQTPLPEIERQLAELAESSDDTLTPTESEGWAKRVLHVLNQT